MQKTWQKQKLGEICEFKYGKGLPKTKRIKGDFPVYGSGGIVDSNVDYLVKGPGIVVGRKGTIGSLFYEPRNFFPIDTVFYIEESSNIYNLKFLFYGLSCLNLDKLNSDAAVPGLNRNVAYQQNFNLPPLPTQHKIASILSAYDELIENNTRRIKILEEIAQAIYNEWFVNFRFPGHENVEMVDSELGKIPEGWEVGSFSDYVEINPKLKVDRKLPKPFVNMAGLSEHSMIISSNSTRIGNSGSKFQNGDILFARITPCLENGKTGFVQFLDNIEVGLGSTEFIVFRSKNLCPEYVYLISRNQDFRSNAINSMTGASGRQRVKNECFNNYLLAKPSHAILEEFTYISRPIFNQMYILSKKTTLLISLRDLLLPKLISGEIDVEDLDIDTKDIEQ